jgi:hypothetical protein
MPVDDRDKLIRVVYMMLCARMMSEVVSAPSLTLGFPQCSIGCK